MAYHILDQMEVPVPDDYAKTAETFFNNCQFASHNITKQELLRMAVEHTGFNALGLLSDMKQTQTHHELERIGVPVSFGHSSFHKVLSLMIGIRTSVSCGELSLTVVARYVFTNAEEKIIVS